MMQRKQRTTGTKVAATLDGKVDLVRVKSSEEADKILNNTQYSYFKLMHTE